MNEASEKQYAVHFSDFLDYCKECQQSVCTAVGMDNALSSFFNKMFFDGWEVSVGEKTLAALMTFCPRYAGAGDLVLPRSRKSLQGWRRLAPPRARTPHAIFVVSRIAAMLVAAGELAMAIFSLLAFGTYARPGSLMALRRGSLLEPVGSIGPHWRILLHPSRFSEQSKTGTQDDTLIWDSVDYLWLSEIFAGLKAGAADERLWPFSYPDLCRAVRKASKDLAIQFVPYQWRHSGASWDMARRQRTPLEVQMRGGWRTTTSLVRYEKHGRMISEYARLPFSTRLWLEQVHGKLRDIIVKGSQVPNPPSQCTF